MRLAALLADLPEPELERLGAEHVRTDEPLARPQLCNFLEGAIRSFRFVSAFIINRQPPTFSILSILLERPEYQRSIEGFREEALAEAQGLARLIDGGDLLARDQQLQLYRRSLYEARRSDLDINASEASLLAVLRREQQISQVEHFLIEHHADLREFWDRADSFEREYQALRSAGIIFQANGRVLIPEDVAPAVWQALGIDMPTEAARRLYGHLSNSEMASILGSLGSRVSGTKELRLERLLLDRIQPRAALPLVSLSTLKDICRATDASPTGSKEELIERVVAHFAQGKDQLSEETVETRLPELRRLTQMQFETLFSALLHQELSDILRRQPELRQTGTKETRIRTLWEAQLSEATLLNELKKYQLEDILHRLGLRLSGSKGDRVERIVEHFEAAPVATPQPGSPARVPTSALQVADPVPLEVTANRFTFQQKASNPQISLQPWLDNLLNAGGLVRCYATEDANPTKQLKNKLAQAAAARGGILLLLLSDELAYSKAREALIERWSTNAEWSKSVACVALAFPTSEPTIQVVVEQTPSPWPGMLKQHLFPQIEIVKVAPAADSTSCARCKEQLPPGARFCPGCGMSVSASQPTETS